MSLSEAEQLFTSLSETEQLLVVLRTLSDDTSYALDYDRGVYQLTQVNPLNDRTVGVSPQLSRGEMVLYLNAFVDGMEAQRGWD
jgi:hypothetical protein